MRKAVVFIGITFVAALIALWVLPRLRPVVRVRPPAPTAEEEAAGTSSALEPDVRPAPRAQVPAPPLRRDHVRPSTRQAPVAHAQNMAPVQSAGAPEEASAVLVGRGRREEATASGSPENHGQEAGPMKPVQAGGADRTPVLTPPVLVSQGALAYPSDGYRLVLDRDALTPRLRLDAGQGRVVLRILVRSDGAVARVEVAQTSGNQALDEAAVRTATVWAFVPATRDGEPIEAWVVLPMRFVVP